jgi:hypothetical protein
MTDITQGNATANDEDLSTGADLSAGGDTSVESGETQDSQDSEPTSLRDAISAAFDKAAGQPPEGHAAGKAPSVSVPKPTTEPTEEIDPLTGEKLLPIKPPTSWTPTLREQAWSKIPRDAQKFIIDRERDIAKSYSKHGADSKFVKEFTEVLTPFDGYFKQYGLDAKTRIGEVLAIDHALVTGSPQSRAELIYNLIQTFQPDPQVLGALFSGRAAPQTRQQTAQQPVDIDAEVNKRLQQQQEEAFQKESDTAIQEFADDPANEFYGDVRELMGRIINAGLVDADTPKALLKAAYERACQEHPEVKAILAKRNPVIPQGKAPVRSTTPSLGSSGAARAPVRKKTASLRDDIEAAFDELSQK